MMQINRVDTTQARAKLKALGRKLQSKGKLLSTTAKITWILGSLLIFYLAFRIVFPYLAMLYKVHQLKDHYIAVTVRERIVELPAAVVPVKPGKSKRAQKAAKPVKPKTVTERWAEYDWVSERPKNWVDAYQINPLASAAIILSEDWAFFQHEGLDYYQILRSLTDALRENRPPRGASTLTQQLVKNLFFEHDRSWSRKFQEAWISLYLEKVLSKQRILEIYFNIVEFGPGIYGMEPASRHYFRKPPQYLNAKEGAFLAMLLPSPKRYYRSFRQGELTPFASQVIRNIMYKLYQAGLLSEYRLYEMLQTSLVWERGG